MRNKKACIWFGLTLLWMAVIFLFSSQNAADSSALSGGITEWLTKLIHKEFHIFSPSYQQEVLGRVSFFIRKTAHFTEYAILGFLFSGWLNSMVNLKGAPIKRNIIVWILGTLYAVSDEIHQNFSDGRAPRCFDVCIDSVGVIAGILIFFLVCRILLWYIKYVKARKHCKK